MTKDEAWRIVDECKNWNTSQTSITFAMRGIRTLEDDALDNRREALKKAWRVIADG